MSKLERFFVFGLGVLVVLAVAIVVIVPRQEQQPSLPEQPLAPGETETMPAPAGPVARDPRPSGVWPWASAALAFIGRKVVPPVAALLRDRGQWQPQPTKNWRGDCGCTS